MKLKTIMAGVCVLCCQFEVQAADTDSSELLAGGSAKLDFRYRFEGVEQDGKAEDAKASTLRSRLTLSSGTVKGFSGLIEFDNVSALGAEEYNSTSNGNTQYPVVADPTGTDINQVLVKYKTKETELNLGRQRIVHGTQRFVGGVAWRQNEQTYDGFRAVHKFSDKLSLDYSYVGGVNRIFGPDDRPVQPARWYGNNHFLLGTYTVTPEHKLEGFAYLLDIEPDAKYGYAKTSNNSTDTYGLGYTGKIGDLKLAMTYAHQTDAGESLQSYSADYYFAEASYDFKVLQAKVGYEVLGSDNGVGFKTPLATLHKFQGWADLFLVTPGAGIEDAYAGVSTKVGPVALMAQYHDFAAETGSQDYGTEVDLSATWKVSDQWSLQLKYADFSTDAVAYVDTSRTWLTVQFKP